MTVEPTSRRDFRVSFPGEGRPTGLYYMQQGIKYIVGNDLHLIEMNYFNPSLVFNDTFYVKKIFKILCFFDTVVLNYNELRVITNDSERYKLIFK